jgi:diguanylate cyclase (GGDEF)-like protein
MAVPSSEAGGIPKRRRIAAAFLAAMAFGIVALAGIELTRIGGRVASIWPANGVLLALLVLANRREVRLRITLACAANVAANLISGDRLSMALALAACNAFEIGAALLVMHARAAVDWNRLESPRTLLEFSALICIVPPAASAALASVALSYTSGADVRSVFGGWFCADAAGLLFVTPPVLLLGRDGLRDVLGTTRLLRRVVSLLIVGGVAWVTFRQDAYPLLFLALPPLILAAFSGGFAHASLALLLLASIATFQTLAGHGPIALVASIGPHERVVLLQLFLVVAVSMTLPVASALHERLRLEQLLREQATTDAVTGLATRAKFDEAMRVAWSTAFRHGEPITAGMVDVDHFKLFNDRYGHPTGDVCLARIADILRANFRRATDVVARYGGEEFVVLLPGTDLDAAVALFERVHAALADAPIPHAVSPLGRVTVSVGLSSGVPNRGTSAEELVEVADARLYAAKHAGRAKTIAAGGRTPDDGIGGDVVQLRSRPEPTSGPR